jgi:hypothetical protein
MRFGGVPRGIDDSVEQVSDLLSLRDRFPS